jgi:nitrous oxidase accessory protein NosD
VAISTRSNVTVAGNIADPESGNGFQLESGDNHRLIGNLARNAFRGFAAVNASPTRGLRITDNVAVSNNTGFDLLSENMLVVRRNLATGNDVGFTVNGSGHMLRQNSAVGNRNYGIWIQHLSLTARRLG